MQDEWQEAIELFNKADYWECHEVLEPLWLAAEGLDKSFYSGVILLAAALHKARVMQSSRGGRRNYAKALHHLALIPDQFGQTDVRELEARVHQALRDFGYRPLFPVKPSTTIK
ncbi:MAG: DUF309 domain-containing protein [Trueperaceae bacterium]|nr:DUF309 domain-containing protein [Trueperaceae bacterium]